MVKIQPSVRTLVYEIGDPGTSPPGAYTVDLSESVSRCSRRFYRQGLNWAVESVTVITAPNASGDVELQKIPETWCVSNAWHKSYAAWKRQQDEAIDEAGAESTVAKFRDFKIFADDHHVTSGFAANLDPLDIDGNAFLPGEWEASHVVIPNAAGVVGATTQHTMHMVGIDSLTSFGLVSNYSISRAFPQSPDPVVNPGAPEGSFLSEMFNVGMDDVEVLQNAVDTNNDLPYNQASYPGGGANAPVLEYVDSWSAPPTSITTSKVLRGSNYPCGLIRIHHNLDSAAKVIVRLVPGNSRGYLTQAMRDM